MAAGISRRAGDCGDTDGEAVAGIMVAVNRRTRIANVVGMDLKAYVGTARARFCADRLWGIRTDNCRCRRIDDGDSLWAA